MQIIIAAVLGGRRTILGAAIGAIFLIVAGEILRPLGQLSTFVVSAVALAVILFFPGGFSGLLRARMTPLLEVARPDQAVRRAGRRARTWRSPSARARSSA